MRLIGLVFLATAALAFQDPGARVERRERVERDRDQADRGRDQAERDRYPPARPITRT